LADYRLPDLWLKLEIMRQAARVSDLGRISQQVLASCTIRRHIAAPESTFSRMLKGGLMIDNIALRNLAGAMEYAIRQPDGAFSEAAAKAFTDEQDTLALYPEAILGTIQDFCRAVLRIARPDVTAALLAKALRQQFALLEAGEGRPAHPLVIDGERDRETPAPQLRRERIAFQPDREPLFLEPCTSFQIYVPPHDQSQLVLGLELRCDEGLASQPWEEAASWLGARIQSAGRPGRLLDHSSVVAPVPGVFSVQAVGFDLPEGFTPNAHASDIDDDLLPAELVQLIAQTPTFWPSGYAKAIALLTTAERLARRQEAGGSKARLYHGLYGVRLAPRLEGTAAE